MTRKVIQLVASETNGTMALCDDGTMWVFAVDVECWVPMKPIPSGDMAAVATDVRAMRKQDKSVVYREWRPAKSFKGWV